MLLFCFLFFSIIKNHNVSVFTERENNCAYSGYFRVPGPEPYGVYKLSIYRDPRKIISSLVQPLSSLDKLGKKFY